jgi:hypothetical protein
LGKHREAAAAIYLHEFEQFHVQPAVAGTDTGQFRPITGRDKNRFCPVASQLSSSTKIRKWHDAHCVVGFQHLESEQAKHGVAGPGASVGQSTSRQDQPVPILRFEIERSVVRFKFLQRSFLGRRWLSRRQKIKQ